MNENSQQTDMDINSVGKITSDFEFIKSHMNNISAKTHNCTEFCQKKHTVDSVENQLYSKINGIIHIYYGTQIKLMEKLNYETKSIIKVGETYNDLDNELASKAGDL